MTIRIRTFDRADETDVIALWQRCGLTRPWNDPQRDIARKLSEQPELFLVGTVEDRLIASAMIGFDGHRGWVYYLAVAPDCQRRGYGKRLMAEAERRLSEVGCPKLMLMVRTENTTVIDFYRHLGYDINATAVLGKRLISDE
ncbi:GNAT family acetyltransferase [Phytohalomonas tamaricis]|uniref:GNAT family acetyltransferase n=1 Tax=Phytohalomonas tamaricis TaxID=2081032 RepID=UPI0021D44D8B|nr:GNAT family acetyltransferase [Phytohalomonas tamaricis]